MNLFLLEYITAGGFNTQVLPSNLLPEALAMRDAVLADFHAFGVNIITTHDARLHPSALCGNSLAMTHTMEPTVLWQQLLNECDAALIIAPETDDILCRMTALIDDADVLNLGCHYDAVALTSDKYATFKHLDAQHILTIPTYLTHDTQAIDAQPVRDAYIIKPIDGAGCEDTWHFASLIEAKAWIATKKDDTKFICQPYIVGEAASFTMLCKTGRASVLSCNTQNIHMQQQVDNPHRQLKYAGGVVNAKQNLYDLFTALANNIAHNITGLNGIVGVDVIVQYSLTGEVTSIYVVEINPRITTSYVGLHASLSINPAQLLLDTMLDDGVIAQSTLSASPIEIALHD